MTGAEAGVMVEVEEGDKVMEGGRQALHTVLVGEIQPKRSVPTNFHLLPRLVVSVSLRNIQQEKVKFLALNMHYYCFKSNLI